jgi:hypothetical protein
MQTLASTILNQDYKQMRNQAKESPLKREMMFDKVFDDEEAVVDLHRLFQNYRYPDMNSVLDLYREVQNTCDKP